MATLNKVELPVGTPKNLIAEFPLANGTKYLLQNRSASQKAVIRYWIGGTSAPTDLSEGQEIFHGERLIVNATTEALWAWGVNKDATAVVSEDNT